MLGTSNHKVNLNIQLSTKLVGRNCSKNWKIGSSKKIKIPTKNILWQIRIKLIRFFFIILPKINWTIVRNKWLLYTYHKSAEDLNSSAPSKLILNNIVITSSICLDEIWFCDQWFFYIHNRGEPARDCPSCGAYAGGLKFINKVNHQYGFKHQTKSGARDKRYKTNVILTRFDEARAVFDEALKDERSEETALMWLRYINNEEKRIKDIREYLKE